MYVSIIALHGPGAEQEVNVAPGVFEMGRARDCDLQVDSPLVSRHHCLLLHEDREVRVRDTSRHGTWVNDHRVLDEVPLHDGDVLRLAATEFEVRVLGGDPAPDLFSRACRTLWQALQPRPKADAW